MNSIISYLDSAAPRPSTHMDWKATFSTMVKALRIPNASKILEDTRRNDLLVKGSDFANVICSLS